MTGALELDLIDLAMEDAATALAAEPFLVGLAAEVVDEPSGETTLRVWAVLRGRASPSERAPERLQPISGAVTASMRARVGDGGVNVVTAFRDEHEHAGAGGRRPIVARSRLLAPVALPLHVRVASGLFVGAVAGVIGGLVMGAARTAALSVHGDYSVAMIFLTAQSTLPGSIALWAVGSAILFAASRAIERRPVSSRWLAAAFSLLLAAFVGIVAFEFVFYLALGEPIAPWQALEHRLTFPTSTLLWGLQLGPVAILGALLSARSEVPRTEQTAAVLGGALIACSVAALATPPPWGLRPLTDWLSWTLGALTAPSGHWLGEALWTRLHGRWRSTMS